MSTSSASCDSGSKSQLSPSHDSSPQLTQAVLRVEVELAGLGEREPYTRAQQRAFGIRTLQKCKGHARKVEKALTVMSSEFESKVVTALASAGFLGAAVRAPKSLLNDCMRERRGCREREGLEWIEKREVSSGCCPTTSIFFEKVTPKVSKH